MKERAHVLVVDDEEPIRKLITFTLADDGYDVVAAANGAIALEHVYAHTPDLILLDMKMPVMDGWAFARAYRELPPPHAPIICMTAARDAGERCVEIAADGVLGKPFTLGELLTVVGQHLG
ncbi:MAG: response regulator [Chloroflexi bacterium]|nr:response regulator [Chloroflexota bacterium]